MKPVTPTIPVVFGIVLATPALSAEREHGIHQHGLGELYVAMERAELAIELVSPAANLVGFEHAPRDATERAALKAAIERLHAGGELFLLPGAGGCQLIEAEVESPLAKDDHRYEGEQRGHTHGHEEGLVREQTPAHADVIARYHFECSRPGAVDRVETRLFAVFPGTERLRVQFAGPGGQGVAELSAGQATVRLR